MFSSKDFEKCWFCSDTPQKANLMMERDEMIHHMGELHSLEMQSLLQKNRFASTNQKMRSVSKKDGQPTRDEECEDHRFSEQCL